jgi:hypothetical protein
LFGEPNPEGLYGTKALRLAENGPSILLESLVVTGEITFPNLPADPNIGLINEELARVELASLKARMRDRGM